MSKSKDVPAATYPPPWKHDIQQLPSEQELESLIAQTRLLRESIESCIQRHDKFNREFPSRLFWFLLPLFVLATYLEFS